MIWTSNTEFTGLINNALVVDAVKTYNLDKNSFAYYFNKLKESNVKYDFVIDKSIKFMRLLNSYIVDRGTVHNEKQRTVYRGINKSIMPNVKPGQTFRIINWVCSSENKSVAEDFWNTDSVLVEFYIEQKCYNAGRINKFGKSVYKTEKETLIPPYTAVKMISREGDYIILEVAQDNKNVDFKMKATSS